MSKIDPRSKKMLEDIDKEIEEIRFEVLQGNYEYIDTFGRRIASLEVHNSEIMNELDSLYDELDDIPNQRANDTTYTEEEWEDYIDELNNRIDTFEQLLINNNRMIDSYQKSIDNAEKTAEEYRQVVENYKKKKGFIEMTTNREDDMTKLSRTNRPNSVKVLENPDLVGRIAEYLGGKKRVRTRKSKKSKKRTAKKHRK